MKRFWEIVIVHKDHYDSEIQIDFRTRWGARRFLKNHIDFQASDDWEIYISFIDLKKKYFGKQERLHNDYI